MSLENVLEGRMQRAEEDLLVPIRRWLVLGADVIHGTLLVVEQSVLGQGIGLRARHTVRLKDSFTSANTLHAGIFVRFDGIP